MRKIASATTARVGGYTFAQTIGNAIAGQIAQAGRERAASEVEKFVDMIGSAGAGDANNRYVPEPGTDARAAYDRMVGVYGEDRASSTALLIAAREEFERGEHSAAMREAFNAMLLSEDSYFFTSIPELLPSGYRRVDEAGLAALGRRPGDFDNPETGFYAALYTYHDRSIGRMSYVLASRGTEGVFDDRPDTRAGIDQYLAIETGQFTQAIQLARALNRTTNGDISFVGHSLGGGLATAQAIATGRKAIVFNALAVRSETLAYAGIRMTDQDIRNRFGSQIMAYSSSGDPLTAGQNLTGILPAAKALEDYYGGQWLRRIVGGGDPTFRDYLIERGARAGTLRNFSEKLLSMPANEVAQRIRSGPESPPHVTLPSAPVPGGGGTPIVDAHLLPAVAYGLLAYGRGRR